MKDLAKMVGELVDLNPEHIDFAFLGFTHYSRIPPTQSALETNYQDRYKRKGERIIAF